MEEVGITLSLGRQDLIPFLCFGSYVPRRVLVTSSHEPGFWAVDPLGWSVVHPRKEFWGMGEEAEAGVSKPTLLP